MLRTDREIAEKARERARKQNEVAKNNWDCVSCRLPKGTKERIQMQGFAVNSFINSVVLAELKRLENIDTVHDESEPQQCTQSSAKEGQADLPEDINALNDYIIQRQKENEQKKLTRIKANQSQIELDDAE